MVVRRHLAISRRWLAVFLMKDVILLAVSVYLLKEDVMRWQREWVFDLRSSTY
jgi:hypothetical protein